MEKDYRTDSEGVSEGVSGVVLMISDHKEDIKTLDMPPVDMTATELNSEVANHMEITDHQGMVEILDQPEVMGVTSEVNHMETLDMAAETSEVMAETSDTMVAMDSVAKISAVVILWAVLLMAVMVVVDLAEASAEAMEDGK